jgi:hypothetical protein
MNTIAHSPKANANGTIDLILNHPEFGEIPFCASPDDSEAHGRELYALALAGEFGPIAPYVAPPLSLADFQKAHDAYLDAKARERKYDSIHTAALRAGYPGPYQAEGIAYAQWMDLCNATGYQILADVQAGNRPMPVSTDAYLALLPTLVLP